MAIIAVVAAAVGIAVSAVSLMEVQALRAEVAALKARTETTSVAPSTSETDEAGPLDLAPWAALPAGEPIRLHRDELQATDEVARGARVVPAFDRGRSMGFKLFSIRDDSLFARLGLQNGDVVVAMHGLPLDSPDRALAAAETLRTATAVNVSIRRRGTPMRIDIVIE